MDRAVTIPQVRDFRDAGGRRYTQGDRDGSGRWVRVLWSLGSVAGIEVGGAPVFLGQPAANGWESPTKLGVTSAHVKLVYDDPDSVIATAPGRGSQRESAHHRGSPKAVGRPSTGWIYRSMRAHRLVGDRSPLRSYSVLTLERPFFDLARRRSTERSTVRKVRPSSNASKRERFEREVVPLESHGRVSRQRFEISCSGCTRCR